MKPTLTRTNALRASIFFLAASICFVGCGGDSKQSDVSPEVAAVEKGLKLPDGVFPKGDDPSLIDYKAIPAGNYVLLAVKANLTELTTNSTYTVGFEYDQKANQILNNTCTPDSKAKENAMKVRGVYLSFESPTTFEMKSGSHTSLADYDFYAEAAMKSTNDACSLSVYASTGGNSAIHVLDIFKMSDASRDGAIYSHSLADGTMQAAFRKGANGGLELLYKASASGVSLLGILYFAKVSAANTTAL